MKKERLDRAWRAVEKRRGQEGERKASVPTRAGGSARTQGRGDNFASHGPNSQHLGSDGSRDPCMALLAANPRPADQPSTFHMLPGANSCAALQRLSQQEPHSSTLGYEVHISASPCRVD
jgi:hypothetical protein